MRRFRPEFTALLALAAGLAAPAAQAGMPAPPPGLCRAGEQVVMACQVQAKQAALCAGPSGAAPATLAYRYGTPRKVELTLNARAGGAQAFGAAVHPAGPQAWVRQVWAEQRNTRYVLTQCVGGGCVHRAGLLVLGPRGVISARACAPNAQPEPAFDAPWLHFGSDLADSRSDSALLRFEDSDNSIEALYPPRPVN